MAPVSEIGRLQTDFLSTEQYNAACLVAVIVEIRPTDSPSSHRLPKIPNERNRTADVISTTDNEQTASVTWDLNAPESERLNRERLSYPGFQLNELTQQKNFIVIQQHLTESTPVPFAAH